LQWLKPEDVEVDIVRVEEPEEAGIEEAELDEMWSYVGKKTNPRWVYTSYVTSINT
jgi:insertion element IS1 protein InsB